MVKNTVFESKQVHWNSLRVLCALRYHFKPMIKDNNHQCNVVWMFNIQGICVLHFSNATHSETIVKDLLRKRNPECWSPQFVNYAFNTHSGMPQVFSFASWSHGEAYLNLKQGLTIMFPHNLIFILPLNHCQANQNCENNNLVLVLLLSFFANVAQGNIM